jgi:hypothetical protein
MRLAVFLLLASTGCRPHDDSAAPDSTPVDDSSPVLDTQDTQDTAPPDDTCAKVALTSLLAADGAPLVRGAMGGQEIWFAVDTAAQVVFADLEVSGGSTEYFETSLQVGPYDEESFLVKGRDLTLNQESLGVDVGGLLGWSILQTSWTAVDSATPAVYLCDHEPAHPPPGAFGPAQPVTFELQNLFPVVALDVGTGWGVSLMVDDGLPVTVITQSVFDALRNPGPQVPGWVFSSNYGSDPAFLVRVPGFDFGAEHVDSAVLAVIPEDHHLKAILEGSDVHVAGFLGNDLLSRVLWSLTSDGVGGAFTTWPLEGGWGDDPNLWVRVGLDVAWRDGVFVVDKVLKGSSAALQGVAVGDVLVGIDGVDSATLDRTAVLAALAGEAGEVRHLDLTRGGSALAVDVEVEELVPGG